MIREHSAIGEELRPPERLAVWDGICPDCGGQLVDGHRGGAMLIVCATWHCDFSCSVQRKYSLKGDLAPDSPWMTGGPRVVSIKGAAS